RAVGTRSPMLPRSAGHRYPPSFPTRRSSDLELRHELLGPGELVADHAQVRPLRRQGGPGDLDRGQHGVVHEEDEAGRADGADLGLGVVLSGVYGVHGSSVHPVWLIPASWAWSHICWLSSWAIIDSIAVNWRMSWSSTLARRSSIRSMRSSTRSIWAFQWSRAR